MPIATPSREDRAAKFEAGRRIGTARGREAGSIAKCAELIAIIEPRALSRETLAAAFSSVDRRYCSRSFADIEGWRTDPERNSTAALLVCIDALEGIEGDAAAEIRRLVDEDPTIPAVAISECEDPDYIAKILSCGARGYIPTSVSLGVAVQAVSLAIAGGVFVPAGALRTTNIDRRSRPDIEYQFGLTGRQAAVAEAMARGTPSKIIAHELGLMESTVKVHIRNIMRKLRVRNRTEAAFKLHQARAEAPRSSKSVRHARTPKRVRS